MIHQLLLLLADAEAGQLDWWHAVQFVFMVLIGAIGSLIRMSITDFKKSVEGMSCRMDRNCRRLQRVELDIAKHVGRHVRRVKDDVEESDEEYEDESL